MIQQPPGALSTGGLPTKRQEGRVSSQDSQETDGKGRTDRKGSLSGNTALSTRPPRGLASSPLQRPQWVREPRLCVPGWRVSCCPEEEQRTRQKLSWEHQTKQAATTTKESRTGGWYAQVSRPGFNHQITTQSSGKRRQHGLLWDTVTRGSATLRAAGESKLKRAVEEQQTASISGHVAPRPAPGQQPRASAISCPDVGEATRYLSTTEDQQDTTQENKGRVEASPLPTARTQRSSRRLV